MERRETMMLGLGSLEGSVLLTESDSSSELSSRCESREKEVLLEMREHCYGGKEEKS